MAMKFLQKWVLDPLNDFTFGYRRFLENVGLQPFLDKTIYAMEEVVFYQLFKTLYDFKIINPEVIPKEGAAIFASNHTSLLDPIIVGDAICHPTKRQAYQLAKAELMADALLNNFTRMNKAIFIRRGDNDDTALDRCKGVLDEGNLLVVFPEGTLSEGNGKFLEFKTGTARLAYDCQVPIIPTAIYGSDKIFGKNSKMPATKGKLRVKFGEPLTIEKLFKISVKSNETVQDKLVSQDNLDYSRATRKIQREVEKLWMDIWSEEQEAEKGQKKGTENSKSPQKV